MQRREETVGTIVRIEWEMMDKVQNCGGRAHCQDDWETFRLMRTSQMRAWDSLCWTAFWMICAVPSQRGGTCCVKNMLI